jgi:hypothetical protein
MSRKVIAGVLAFVLLAIFGEYLRYHPTVNQIRASEVRLQAMADSYLPLFDNMPSSRIIVLDSEHFHEICERTKPAGACAVPGRIIFISTDTLLPDDLEEKVLKHELTHEWIFWKEIHDGDHGPEFQRKLQEVMNE